MSVRDAARLAMAGTQLHLGIFRHATVQAFYAAFSTEGCNFSIINLYVLIVAAVPPAHCAAYAVCIGAQCSTKNITQLLKAHNRVGRSRRLRREQKVPCARMVGVSSGQL